MNDHDQIWHERGLRDAVLTGDEAAWRTLYERYFASLYAYVHYRTGRSGHQTEDAVQDCWLVAVRRVRDFDPARGSFESWLRGIADNVLRAQRRRRERGREVRAPSGDPGWALRAASKATGPGRDVDLAEQIACVMSGLPLRYQEVLRAKYDENLRVAEIGRRTGMTGKAIESLLSRARALFREAFDRTDKER